MHVDNPMTFIGLLGVVTKKPMTPELIKALKQVSTRIDTLICFKNMSAEHQMVLGKANNALDKDGLVGIGQTVVLLELLARSLRAGLVYLQDLYEDDVPVHER
jgi:hypothetical protein